MQHKLLNIDDELEIQGPQIKVLIKNFNSELLISLLNSFLTSLDSVDLQVLFDISFIRFRSLKMKLQSFSGDVSISIAEKCFDIGGILKMASVKSVGPGTILLAKITLLDVDLNFYHWDFRNLSWF